MDELFDTIPKLVVPTNSTLELECRFSIDSRKKEKSNAQRFSTEETIKIAKFIISKHITQKDRCEIEQSINFIGSGSIRQMYFINGEQKKDKHKSYRKEALIEPIIVLGNPAYKIHLSYEHITSEIKIADCTSARIRLRFSIFSDEFKKWRLDITLIKNISSLVNPQELKSGKSNMLFPISVDNFVDKAPWSIADTIEFEAEYVQGTLTIEDVKNIDDYITNVINEVLEIKDTASKDSKDNNYQEKIYEVAKYIKPNQAEKFRHKFGMKQLSNQVIEMDKNTYLRDVANHVQDYYITDKVDGKRAIIYITGTECIVLTDTLDTLELDKHSNLDNLTYIFDCEQYANKQEFKYYIFDVIVWKGKSLVDKPFEERMKYFEAACTLVPNLMEKPFIRLTDAYKTQIKKLKESKKPYETDGFVLTPYDGQYNIMQVYKYKPIDKISIDFLIKKCPSRLLGIKPYINKDEANLYLLFCGISRNVYKKLNMDFIKGYQDIFSNINTHNLPDYFPIQFDPSDRRFVNLYWHTPNTVNDLDGEVGEFHWDSKHEQWSLIRIRTDRKVEVARGNYFGNNYKIAELTWLSYQNPLIIEGETDDLVYFQESDSELHKPSRNFNSFVKSRIFEQFKDTEWTMDLASGKGQDLFRYAKSGMRHVLFVEIDKTALSELTNRKHDFANDYKSRDSMTILTHNLDLNESYKRNIEILEESKLPLPVKGFDIIICNLAFHYLVKDKSAIQNIVKFIDHYLEPGGRFIFTTFDGKQVFDLLRDTGEYDALPKFHIKAEYKGTTLAPFGQKISVLLPFSKETYYSEYLVNRQYLEDEFKKAKFVLENDQSFGEYLDEYSRANKQGFNSMDDQDKTYVSLYHAYYFYKNKK